MISVNYIHTYSSLLKNIILGAFRKITKSDYDAILVCLSVCPHGKIRTDGS
jgi:hypothetical protein